MENENKQIEEKSSKKKFIIKMILLFIGLYVVSAVATYFICLNIH